MFKSMSYKSKQFFFVIVKLSIVAGAFYFIFHKLVKNESLSFSVFYQFLKENNVFSTKNVVFLMFLTIFNWFFEILKWKYLVSNVTHIPFFSALKQSLSGLTASLFTPNRIGEYGAKVIYFQYALRKKILLLNLIGNMYQMLITCLFGIIGLLIVYTRYNIEINLYIVFVFFSII